MKREYLSVRESDDFTTIIQTERPGYFKKLVATGAVIEQGITIRPVYNLSTILDEEKIDKNSNNRPNLVIQHMYHLNKLQKLWKYTKELKDYLL